MLNFPEYAVKCIKKLEENGFEAYLVGGCVRDGLIGVDIHDVDITTSALPDQIEALFEKTIPTGIEHGTITVITDDGSIEITTFRWEDNYQDSRHPESVTFVRDIKKDLSRRDFTINAMAYNQNTGLIDVFGGVDDLNGRIIATVGDPATRFKEDALRIMRAFRFSSSLGFDIEKNTLKAALEHSHLLCNISGERIYSELCKLSCGKNTESIIPLLNTKALLPFGIGLPKYSKDKFTSLSSEVFNNSTKTAILIMLTEYDLKLIKSMLHADNVLIHKLTVMEAFGGLEVPTNKFELKRILSSLKNDEISVYFDYMRFFKKEYIRSLDMLYKEIRQNHEPFRISELAIDGRCLLNYGIVGKEVGEKLNTALNAVMLEPSLNTKENLLKYLKL